MAFTFIGPTDDGSRGQVPGSLEDVRNQMNILVNAVWYISGNLQTIQERGVHLPEIQKIPEVSLLLDFFNCTQTRQ